ncbi:MAG: 30S ribosomal protein S18 [Parcubacteria group bacterium]|nr:30S ribosomal protein S18 [Parcubacteria group bacterium]
MVCQLCQDNRKKFDYKNAPLLRRFLMPDLKIKPRKYTGLCIPHQKRLARAIKTARQMALLPATSAHQRKFGRFPSEF